MHGKTTKRHSEVKHRLIYEHIHGGILAGEYSVGERIPTEEELADRFETSRVTVARALHDLERQGFLLRRRGSGSFVRMPGNPAAQLIGLITGDSPGIFASLCDEISCCAQTRGYSVLLGKWPNAALEDIVRHTHALSEQYINRRVAGVIFEPMYVPEAKMPINAEIAEAFVRANIPVVLLDRDIHDFPRRSRFDLVGVDNRQGGFALTEHLLSLGYRRIHFLTQALTASTVTARMTGYHDALTRRGITPDPQWVHHGDARNVDFVRRAMRAGPPEAFVCSNDLEAAKLMNTLEGLKVRIPRDVAIVGFNDDPYARLLTVSLTTVRQPCPQLGAAAVKLLLNRISNRSTVVREVRLRCELVVRESCGAQLAARVKSQ